VGRIYSLKMLPEIKHLSTVPIHYCKENLWGH